MTACALNIRGINYGLGDGVAMQLCLVVDGLLYRVALASIKPKESKEYFLDGLTLRPSWSR